MCSNHIVLYSALAEVMKTLTMYGVSLTSETQESPRKTQHPVIDLLVVSLAYPRTDLAFVWSS